MIRNVSENSGQAYILERTIVDNLPPSYMKFSEDMSTVTNYFQWFAR